ncbi:T9SS type A sorting domain-containing protein [Bernardetia sp. Wsw4-3y2]|uniref:T9SS type A sorting domain-containing protein n=1 Tax=Bernardetia sp. Wsw4-3y2 TaxID=3127471 RepID=UPI0030CD5FDB
MKTTSYFFSLLIAFFCISQLQAQSPQLKKWYLNQFEVDFSTTLPQVNSLPQTYPIVFGGTSSNGFARNSHGHYDDNGNILFYTAAQSNGSFLEYRVINGQGAIIGTLTETPDNSAEMSMIPFGCNAPNKYLLIYSAPYTVQKLGKTEKVMAPCWSRLVYTVIDLGTNTVSPSYQVPNLDRDCPSKAQAVGKPRPDGTRWLYTNAERDIVKCKIDFTQSYSNIISVSNVIHAENHIMNIVELELSPNQNFLAWTDRANDVNYDFAVMALDSNGDRNMNGVFTKQDIPTSSFNPNIPKASGIEFVGEGVGNFFLFVGFNTFGTDTAKDGIYNFNFINYSLTQLANTSGFVKSHIERAGNGRCYAVNANSLLDISALSITTLPNSTDYFPYDKTGATVIDYQNINDYGVYILPDQVDGEVISSNYTLPDVSHLTGNVCKSDAILSFPTSISNYTITVEKPFQTPCVYQGTARTLDLTTICDIQCGGNACDNRYRIKIEATLCNGQQLVSQSGVFNILCAPAKPVVQIGHRFLCPEQTTWGKVTNSYPQGTTIEWFQGGNLFATGASITGISGSFTVRITDASGCSVEENVLIGLKECNKEVLFKTENNSINSIDDSVIYPNPAKNQATIKLFENEVIEYITIKDARGMLVKSYKNVSEVTKTIDISKLSVGFYIVEVISQNKKQYISKLIVE